jgi:hypothetical protein
VAELISSLSDFAAEDFSVLLLAAVLAWPEVEDAVVCAGEKATSIARTSAVQSTK